MAKKQKKNTIRIKRDDVVVRVIAGKPTRAKKGRVLEVLPEKQRVRVEGRGDRSSATSRPRSNPRHPEGGIIEAGRHHSHLERDADGARSTVARSAPAASSLTTRRSAWPRAAR
jgi:hypothetical protein